MTATELVAQAARLGIQVLGITDHDTTDGLATALEEAERWDITVVPGVEISTVSGREEIHMLGYFVDVGDPELQVTLSCTRQARWERAQKMLVRLANLGLPIEWERVIEISGGSASIGRPHVAATLLEAGHVSSFDEAFNVWIGRGCPAYVERHKLSPEDAIALIRRGGGVPVLAHPYLYTRRGECKASLELSRWLPRLRDAGLEGIEAYYPHYTHRVNRHLLAWAVRYDLLVTGGSDYHGGAPARSLCTPVPATHAQATAGRAAPCAGPLRPAAELSGQGRPLQDGVLSQANGFGNGLGSVAVPWAVWDGLVRRHRLCLRNSVAACPVGMHGERSGQARANDTD